MMKIDSTENLLNYCLKKKKSLTPSRTLVIKTLSKHKKPISAYELRDEINKNKDVNINISQIYRVLEFWIDLGLIHKISSINKFLLCITPEEKHTHMLSFCTVCEKVFETCNEQMGLNLKKSTAKLDLAFNNTRSVEIPVICPQCS
ncbi:MAG: transcriptional repressor [Alphaproteobacteria bacterium]|nr:MAG: transcriptional repressor [Alphaproteobacteria bacterium]